MASLRELGFHSHSHPHHHHHQQQHNKITKTQRGGKMVKPILKKLASSSPKNSLDLDRGWEEQPVDFGGYGNSAYESGRTSMSRSVRDVSFYPSTATWEPTGYSSSIGEAGGGGGGGGGGGQGAGGGSTTASGTASPVLFGGGLGLGLEAMPSSVGATAGVTRNTSRSSAGRFAHVRTTSGTSHVSIATNGSSHRPGASFVHPFQQTPRTNTPPLAYAHSFTSFERDTHPARDYSPTIITENDDDDDADDDDDDHHHHQHRRFHDTLNPASSPLLARSHGSSSTSTTTTNSNSNSNSNNNSHRHSHAHSLSLASQRTSSLSDLRGAHPPPHHTPALSSSGGTSHTVPSLRVNTAGLKNPTAQPPRSVPSASSRLAHGPLSAGSSHSHSHSDLALHLNTSHTDSPRPSIHLASPSTSTTAPMSPLRTSLEGAFRLRSRSEVETGVSRVDIREARRKFEENERIKQEKYEAEQRRKQARRQERDKATRRKNNAGGNGGSGSDLSIIGRPSFSRKRTPPLASARRTRSDGAAAGGGGGGGDDGDGGPLSEKMPPNQPGAASAAFLSSNYESTEGGAAPDFGLDVHDVRFETPPRAHTAKRKTQSYWTSFMLWLRTRLLRLGRH